MPIERIIFVGAHLGYAMDRVPLGGGAMVGRALVRAWSKAPLVAIGAGSLSPDPAVPYIQLPAPGPEGDPALVDFSARCYARFCRRFESEVTEHVLRNAASWEPARTLVLANDISEGPDFARLKAAGFRCASIWHVDVVDFFCRMYLRGALRPAALAALHEAARRLGLAGALPDVLKLVLEKQRLSAESSERLIVPSRAMRGKILECYGRRDASLPGRVLVLPWGVLEEGPPPEDWRPLAERLRRHYQIGERTRVLMTLSRVSPEKGIDRLLEALRHLEASPGLGGADLCVLLCGESAFMGGAACRRRLGRMARRLRRARVFFPGYLDRLGKAAYLSLADLFVSLSRHESYGLSLAEALRAGVPALAGSHGGVEELLSADRGVVLKETGPLGVARALEELLGDPARLRAMAARAREASRAWDFRGTADRLLGELLALP